MSQIKNFPHQYNDLSKLRATAEVYADLQREGANSADDGELGYALAESHIYRFRGMDYEAPEDEVARELRARIAAEKQKPQKSQGPRTAAREMRRTMRALGWINGEGDVTAAGLAVLSTVGGSPQELRMLQTAMMEVTAADSSGHLSHPMRILMRLIEDVRFPSRKGMELALVAKDDSSAEYQRILGLARLDPETRLGALGATPYKVANAIKILPALLLNTGMVRKDASGHFVTTEDGRAALKAVLSEGAVAGGEELGAGAGYAPVEPGRVRVREGLAKRKPEPKPAADVGALPTAADFQRATLTPEQQREAARRLMERTRNHQEIAKAVAARAGAASVFEDPFSYDLLFEPASADIPMVLWEAKTVDGDTAAQVRAAIGQLHYYEFFFVRPHWRDRQVLKAAVFDETPNDELCEFMREQDCAAFVIRGDELAPLNTLATRVADVLVEL